MLSLQCNRLRNLADDVQRIQENNADWLWRDAVTLVDAATEMRHAAETIKSLRDNLSDMVGCCVKAWELEGENAKLRKLVQYILDESYGDDWFITKAEELGIEERYQ